MKTIIAPLFKSMRLICVTATLMVFPLASLTRCQTGPASLPVLKTGYDLVVTGATPGGIGCAVRAAREGLKVLLVERTQHIGGFLSSGAGGWEAPYDGFRSPLYSEATSNISAYYKRTYGDSSTQYRASKPAPTGNRHIDRSKNEPKVAEMIFEEMVGAEKNISLLKGYYPLSVTRNGNKIASVKLKNYNGEDTVEVQGKIFADCTYEGDLAALAGAAYRVGRESREEYNEPHAGVVYTRNCVEKGSTQRFSTDAVEGKVKIRTFPGLMCKEEVMPESPGAADSAVMVYNYRLILTSDPANRIPIQKPAGYDPEKFTGFDGGREVPDIPNQKIGYNSGKLIGPQIQYPEGNWKVRDSISNLYLNYALQQLYFLQHDAPAEIQKKWSPYGLAKDEFTDNRNLPYEVYVREARRIVGKYVFTEQDNIPTEIERTKIHSDAVAITDWPVDHVACIDRSVPGGNLDGILFLAESSKPAQIPFRCMLPKDINNLLVPVCLSTSHVGWGSVRLEPVWMQTGEAAGFAAALSVQSDRVPSELDSDILLRKLVDHKFEVALFNDLDTSVANDWKPAIQYFATKGFFRGYNARPAENLDLATAKIWLTLFDKLRTKEKYDETRAAKQQAQEGVAASSADVSLQDFKKLFSQSGRLEKAFVDSRFDELKINSSEKTISRGKACLVMYNLLEGE